MSQNEIIFLNNAEISLESLVSLYQDVYWTAYTRQPIVLAKAIQQSLFVISAWKSDELVGLIRIIGDGLTIIYIQDILVKKAHQRKGIGKSLMEQALGHFPDVRQKVLLTDDTERTRAFYQSMGFRACDDGALLAFAKYD